MVGADAPLALRRALQQSSRSTLGDLRCPCPSPGALVEARFCCNGLSNGTTPMGAAIYLALVGGGLATAFVATVVLKGIRLI